MPRYNLQLVNRKDQYLTVEHEAETLLDLGELLIRHRFLIFRDVDGASFRNPFLVPEHQVRWVTAATAD